MAEHLIETVLKPEPLSRYSVEAVLAEADKRVPRIMSAEHLARIIESDPNCVVEARVHHIDPVTKAAKVKSLDRTEFLETCRQANDRAKMREGADAFATDGFDTSGYGLVGESFVPLLGGPFFKQLYQRDFILAANSAFYAFNHHPIAHQAVNIIVDFTLGRGFRVDSKNKAALAIWRAFEDANNLQHQMLQAAREMSINGETAFWKLPNNQATIVQRPYPGQKIPKALLPRVRVVDTTVFWDYCTEPEDVTNIKWFTWLAPTQWQVFTSGPTGSVPTTKFIYQTVPAEQINFYKINCFSNEKRGRSDLFPVLGFLKRLTDSVNYQIIALQKQSSFCIDTTVKGSQADVDNYISDMQSGGTIAPAGSEFVHTEAIERKYVGVEGARGGMSEAFSWTLSMVAAGIGIPISYFGTHLSGGQTRASAIVATEPVAKKFELRQQMYEQMLHDLWDYVMEWAGITDAECEVTFPEIITADKSQKLKDISLAKAEGYISQERAANMVAKELNITEFDYHVEKAAIEKDAEGGIGMAPLTSPPGVPNHAAPKPAAAMSGVERSEIKDEGTA